MFQEWVLPGLLETGPVDEQILAVRDGLVNFYVVRGPAGLVCVDAGWRPHSVRAGFKTLGLELRDVAAVFLTHRHWDHARCADLYPHARVFAGGGVEEGSAGRPLQRVRDGDLLNVAGVEVRAVATPGHTPDSVCYVVAGRFLFTGDALRLRRSKVGIFPTRCPSDRESVRRSIRKLAALPGIELLLTGHTGATREVEAAFQDWREDEPR